MSRFRVKKWRFELNQILPDGHDLALASLQLVFGVGGVAGSGVAVLGHVVGCREALLLELVDGVDVQGDTVLGVSGDALQGKHQ